MKYITLLTALAAAIPAAFGLTVSSPASVVECEPTQFNWSGGTGPYFFSLLPAGQTAASPIKDFGTQTGTSLTWTVDLQSGVSFTASLKDSTGAVAYSSIITIQAGTSTSCVNTSVNETGGSGGGSGGAASTGSSGSTAAGSTGTSASGATATGASASSPSGSTTGTASSSSSTHSSGADRLTVSSAFGAAGIMGLVGALLF